MAEEERTFHVVGTPREKVDAGAKVTGQTLFADDLVLPRMLHCKLHRSRYAHAKIKRVDTRRASALPGVIAVLTGDALPIPFGILPISQDEHALCQDVARFVGDPIAAVAAIDEMTAEEACRLIAVEYEPLRAIESVDDAIATPSPQLHEYGDRGNIHKEIALDFGGVDEAMKGADYIADDTFFYEGNTHLAIEQHATLAQWSTEGKLTVWSSTQTPHYLHRALAKVLQMPPAHIRVIATPERRRLRRQIGSVQSRNRRRRTRAPHRTTREDLPHARRGLPLPPRTPPGAHARAHRREERWRIVAMDFASVLDGGAYGSYGVACTYYTGALQTVTYEIPAYRFRGLRVFTNKPPCGPKRGHGTPQPRFGLEVQLDKIAEHLQLDPAEMRSKILQPPNSADRELAAHRFDGPRPVHRRRGARERLAREVPQAPLRPRRRHRVLLLPLRREPAHLLEPASAFERAAQARPLRRRHRLLRQRPTSARAPTRCSRCSSPKSSASSRWTSASSPATRTSPPSTSARTPRASRS